MPPKMIILDCGETIEIHTIDCHSHRTKSTSRQNFLDAKWDAVNEAYLLPSGPLSVRGLPEIKRDIERLRAVTSTGEIEAKLEEDLKRQKSSERAFSAYGYLLLSALLLFLITLALSQYVFALIAFASVVALRALMGPFTRRYAPWLGLVKSQEMLIVRLKRAADEFDRFVAEKSEQVRTNFLDEGVRLLEVSHLFGEVRTGGWAVLVTPAQQMKRALENVSQRIAPDARKSLKNPERISRDILPRLRSLIPLLVVPDIELIKSWNDAIEKEFSFEDRSRLAKLRTTVLTHPRLRMWLPTLFVSTVFLLVGYSLATVVVFLWGSFRTGSLLQLADFATLVKEWQFLLLGVGLTAVLIAVYALRREKDGHKKG